MLCKLCKKVFSNQEEFLAHCRKKHTTEDGLPRFTCPFDGCERQYCIPDSFRHHLRSHPNQPSQSLNKPDTSETLFQYLSNEKKVANIEEELNNEEHVVADLLEPMVPVESFETSTQ